MWDKLTWFKNKLANSTDGPFSKRNIVALLLIGIGVLSVPLGVDLVQTQTNLRSQAADYSAEQIRQCNEQIVNERNGIPIVPVQCKNDAEIDTDDPNNSVCTWMGWKTYDELRDYMKQQNWVAPDNKNCSVLKAFNGQKLNRGQCVARVQEEYRGSGATASLDPWVKDKTMSLVVAKDRGFKVGALNDKGYGDFGIDAATLTLNTPDGQHILLQNEQLYKPTRTGTYTLVASGGDKNGVRCAVEATVKVTNQCASWCSQCLVKSQGPAFLVTYREGGWTDTSCTNYDAMVNDWCTSAGPADCQRMKTTTCASECRPGVVPPQDDSSGIGGAALPSDSTPQTGARGSATCSNQTANLSWSGFTAPAGQTITNYTLRLNKSPFDWAPEETCSETAATRGDCTLQAGSVTTKNLKLSDGTYGFSVQPGFSNGAVGQTVNLPEFSCGTGMTGTAVGSSTAPQPPTALRASSVCSNGQMTLRWKRADGATGYLVKVNGTEVKASIPADPLIRPYAVFKTQKGQVYDWTVQSVNSAGPSPVVTGNPFSCNT